MGIIYKIENSINNKVYIGQTIHTAKHRWQQHIAASKAGRGMQYPLYKALAKYGLDNFRFEIIEEIDNQLLDEREKYWIKFYNSYRDGYNATIGGNNNFNDLFELQEVLELYHAHKSARKVAEILQCDHNTIDNILNTNKIYRYTESDRLAAIHGRIIVEKNAERYIFNSIAQTGEWFVQNKICRAKTKETARKGVAFALDKQIPYYGYKIYREK